jgi:hypothetical protein
MNTLNPQDYKSWTHEQMSQFHDYLQELCKKGKALIIVNHINDREFLYDGWIYEFAWASPLNLNSPPGGSWMLLRRIERQEELKNAAFDRCYQPTYLVDSMIKDEGREINGRRGTRIPVTVFTYKGWYCEKRGGVVNKTNWFIEDGINTEMINNIDCFYCREGILSLEELVEIIKMREANSD